MKKIFNVLVVLLVISIAFPASVHSQAPEPPPDSDDGLIANPSLTPTDGSIAFDGVNGGSPQGPSWQVERIDDRHVFSNTAHHNLKIDSLGNPHIVYGGDHLYHTWWGSGTWHTEVVDPAFNVGSYASLAIDNQNNLHIAYYDAGNKDLKYAQNRMGYWYIVTLVSAGDVGQGTDIGVDAARDPYFIYRDNTNYHLMFAALTNGNMEEPPENISGTKIPGTMFSMAMRGPGDVHVIFNSVSEGAGELLYTSTKQTTPWSPAWIYDGDTYTGRQADIALDSNGNPHVIFGFSDSALGYEMVRYFVTTDYGVGWYTSLFDDFIDLYMPDGLALALTASNQPLVAYQYGGQLYKYTWNGSAWNKVLVDPGTGTGYAPAIALYPSTTANAGAPAFAYFDDPAAKNIHINYREMYMGSWWPADGPSLLDQSEKVGGCSTTLTGPDGNPWLIYSGDTTRKLYFKHYYNGQWGASQEIGSEYSGIINCYHAAAAGGGKAAVLFTTENANLLYATITCSGPTCVISPSTMIETTLATPWNFIDLTLDANGYPHMVYLVTSGASRQLLYLYDVGSGWVAKFGPVIDTPSASNRPLSIKRTAGGVLHILYQKYALYDSLYYVNFARGSWSEPLRLGQDADQEEIYQGISVSLDPTGNPAVAYIDSIGTGQINLKQRTCGTTCTWPATPFVVDTSSTATAFRYPSLSMDAFGRYRLSYIQLATGTRYLQYVQVTGAQKMFHPIASYAGLGDMSSLAFSPAGLGRVSFNDDTNGDLLFAWQDTQVFLPVVIR